VTTIRTKEDWISVARSTVPLLPDYMADQSGQVVPSMVETELSRLVDAEDWKTLHQRFEEIWAWLPDDPRRSLNSPPPVFRPLRPVLRILGVRMTTLMVADLKADERCQPNRKLVYLAVDNGHGFEEVVTESTSRLKARAALVAAASNLNRGVPTEKTK
jgi:hypothetical protein